MNFYEISKVANKNLIIREFSLILQNDKRIETWASFYDRAKRDIIESNARDRHSGVALTTRIDYGAH